ncbi:MAG: response regulator [Victivallales bacterium]
MKKILIVDDEPVIRLILATIIRRKGGFEMDEASSVKDAVSLCAAKRYDLIFLDHNLKDGGVGWEIAEMISLDPRKYGSPRIIAMSGSIFPGKEKEVRKYYAHFIPKPFEVSKINAILDTSITDKKGDVAMKRTSKSMSGASCSPQIPVYTAKENIQRLGRTSILEDFARENDNHWDHQKWLGLCERITNKGFSPIDFDHVGLMLEEVKARYPNI